MKKRKRKTKVASTSVMDELVPGFSARSDRGRRSRAKGVKNERDVANELKDLYPDAKRLFGQAREGSENPDIGGTPWWIETADSEASIESKLRQGLHDSAVSESQQYGGLRTLVITKKKSMMIVSMSLEQWKAREALLRILMQTAKTYA